MTDLNDLLFGKSISEMSDEEIRQTINDCRARRRVVPTKKAAKKAGIEKLDKEALQTLLTLLEGMED